MKNVYKTPHFVQVNAGEVTGYLYSLLLLEEGGGESETPD